MAFEYYIYNTQTLIANRESISVFVANSKNGVSIKKFPVAGEVALQKSPNLVSANFGNIPLRRPKVSILSFFQLKSGRFSNR